jgi:hypothetical protein
MGALSTHERNTVMPTFDTPEPITATIELGLGEVRITAAERADTVVAVEPSDLADALDREVAERTRVTYANGQLVVEVPKLRSWRLRKPGGSIVVTIELPAGSHVHGKAGVANFHCEGSLGDCRITTGVGRIQLDEARTLTVKSGASDIAVERVVGHVDIGIASGDVRLRELGSTAVIKKSNDDTWIGVADGDVEVSTANGDISVDVANAAVSAKTARGNLRVGDVARASAVLETYVGDIEVGIREGTAAWLEAKATAGKVRNELEPSERPDPAAETVEIRARTTVGSVVIRRPVPSAVSA